MSDPMTLTPELHAFATRLQLLLPPLLSTQRSSWEQGICAQALLECHRFLSDASFSESSLSLPYDLVQWLYALAHDSLVRQGPDGRLSVLLNGDGTSDTGALDPACVGETLYYLCALEAHSMTLFPSPRGAHSASLLEGVENMLAYVMNNCPRASVGLQPHDILLSHRTDSTEIWSDSVYMLPPFLAAAAAFRTVSPSHRNLSVVATDTYTPRELLEMALTQITLAADVLQAPSGEWSHMYDLRARAFKRRAFWGVGNGWVCCGIVRVISTLLSPTATHAHAHDHDQSPGDAPHLAPTVCPDLATLGLQPARPAADSEPQAEGPLLPLLRRVYAILRRTLRACLAHAPAPPALFPNDLSDARSFPETNLAQMLAYALFRLADLHAHSPPFRALQLQLGGEGEGEGEGEEVQGWVERAHALRAAAVGMTDRWGFVRDVCGSPNFDGPGTAAEGQAWGVLMEVARAQYMWHERQAGRGGAD